MDIEAILQEVHREYLVRMTHGDGQLLRQVEQYATARQGKMLRPRLTLLAAATTSMLPNPRYKSLEPCFLFMCPTSTIAQSYNDAQIASCLSILLIPEAHEMSVSPKYAWSGSITKSLALKSAIALRS